MYLWGRAILVYLRFGLRESILTPSLYSSNLLVKFLFIVAHRPKPKTKSRKLLVLFLYMFVYFLGFLHFYYLFLEIVFKPIIFLQQSWHLSFHYLQQIGITAKVHYLGIWICSLWRFYWLVCKSYYRENFQVSPQQNLWQCPLQNLR